MTKDGFIPSVSVRGGVRQTKAAMDDTTGERDVRNEIFHRILASFILCFFFKPGDTLVTLFNKNISNTKKA